MTPPDFTQLRETLSAHIVDSIRGIKPSVGIRCNNDGNLHIRAWVKDAAGAKVQVYSGIHDYIENEILIRDKRPAEGIVTAVARALSEYQQNAPAPPVARATPEPEATPPEGVVIDAELIEEEDEADDA